MKVQINKDAHCGDVEIPAGDYLIAIAGDSGQMTLTGRGRTVKIPATKRRQNSKSRATTVTYSASGGTLWSLVLSTPKFGEWIAMLDVDDTKNKTGRKK